VSKQEERIEEILEMLKEADRLLCIEDCQVVWMGQFLEASVAISLACHKDVTLRPINEEIRNVQQDVWNICVLAYRLEWLRQKAISSDSMNFLWSLSSSIDIEHFHVELRSILDYVAIIVGNTASKKGQVRCKSFESLYEWINKDERNRAKLGDEAAKLVLSIPWYTEVRSTRDFMVHQGDHALVFGNAKDGIHFQVYGKRFKPRIETSYLMWNENVVDFRLYAGLYFARILFFLERLGDFLKKNLAGRVSQQDVNARSKWMGQDTLKEWIGMLISRLNSV